MSYTSSSTAMDQRGLRDVERWREKIEVRLDNRQVFFLFFGSALVACLLFVLGVIVGKRLESRGRALAPEVEDPLALLDKVASAPRVTQTPVVDFPQALFGKNALSLTKKPDTKPAAPALVETNKPGGGGKVEGKSEGTVEGKVPSGKGSEIAALPSPTADKPIKGKELAKLDPPSVASKPTDGKATPVVNKAATPAPAAVEAPKTAVGNKMALVASDSTTKAAEANPTSAKAPVPVVGAATDGAKGKVRFTLQISSFQDRAEAEAFATKIGAEKTYIAVSEIPGKGTWYRVRVGDFASAKDAMAGKQAFEKKYGIIAYVAQR